MNSHLAVGTRVILSPDTRMDIREPWNPLGVEGTVVINSDYGVYVSWDTYDDGGNGIYYAGADSDLLLAKKLSFTSRDKARERAKECPSFIVVDLGTDAEERWVISTKEI